MKREKIDSISRPDASKDVELLNNAKGFISKCDKPTYEFYIGTAKVVTTRPEDYGVDRADKKATKRKRAG